MLTYLAGSYSLELRGALQYLKAVENFKNVGIVSPRVPVGYALLALLGLLCVCVCVCSYNCIVSPRVPIGYALLALLALLCVCVFVCVHTTASLHRACP
jgi:hypothetical protein